MRRKKRQKQKSAIFLFLFFFGVTLGCMAQEKGTRVSLPSPDVSGGMSLTEAIYHRECIRSFDDTALTADHLGQILWAGLGQKVDAVTGPTRTAPSAGGLYPGELYLVVGSVDDVPEGTYVYDGAGHDLVMIQDGDLRSELSAAAYSQRSIEDAPAVVVIGAVYERTTRKYGKRGEDRYVKMDAGHISQNIFLQVTALDLGTVTIGAFNDNSVKRVLGISKAEPLYIMPVGHPRR